MALPIRIRPDKIPKWYPPSVACATYTRSEPKVVQEHRHMIAARDNR